MILIVHIHYKESGDYLDIKINNKKQSICNCTNIRRASQAMTGIYDGFLQPGGLSSRQFYLMKHLHSMEPVSVSELASEVRLDRTTLVRNLRPLEDKGFIQDMAEAGTRNRQLKLTGTGLKVLTVSIELWNSAQKFVEDYLGKEDLSTLKKLLLKIEALES